ncbi:MAG: peptidoglycan DD-metalloendopeptidase family protein [Lachnospiraceae bacterium]|nr:peptidoglycan DD-metalloendopeptidase family protein [Lachnospiraceae bacterium]
MDEHLKNTILKAFASFKKNNKDSFKIKISYLLIFIFLISGSFIATYSSYAKAKAKLIENSEYINQLEGENETLENETKSLESENQVYKNNLNDLEEKTNELESKLSELQNTRKSIEETLDKINNGTSSSLSDAQTSCYSDSKENSSSEGILALSSKLMLIESSLENEESAYTGVLGNAEYTLAASSKVPDLWPVYGIVTSEYGYRADPVYGCSAFHQGIDIDTITGDPVIASASGKVKKAEYNPSYGYIIEISHGNGYSSVYAHNSELLVEAGDEVVQGDVVAYAGATGKATGSHLHFEIHLNGNLINPRDVLSWHK